jgi:hypothetical protein
MAKSWHSSSANVMEVAGTRLVLCELWQSIRHCAVSSHGGPRPSFAMPSRKSTPHVSCQKDTRAQDESHLEPVIRLQLSKHTTLVVRVGVRVRVDGPMRRGISEAHML